jgi:hypothetical protein
LSKKTIFFFSKNWPECMKKEFELDRLYSEEKILSGIGFKNFLSNFSAPKICDF